jgi:hypothetical protein
MAEVEPFQDGKVQRVIGRPKPLVERPRRQLAGEPSPSPAFQVVSPSPQPPVPPPEPPREPPRAMPDVTAGHTTVRPAPESRDVATDRKRHPRAMPEIGAAADPGATETEEEPRPMPEIGGAHQQETGSAPEKPRPLHEIG